MEALKKKKNIQHTFLQFSQLFMDTVILGLSSILNVFLCYSDKATGHKPMRFGTTGLHY